MSDSEPNGEIPIKTSGSQPEITNNQTDARENLNMSDAEPNGEIPIKTSGSQLEITNDQTQEFEDRINLSTSNSKLSVDISLKASGSHSKITKKQRLGSSEKRITNFFQEKKRQTSAKQRRKAAQIPPCPSSPSLSTPPPSPSSSSTPTKKKKTNAKKTPKKTKKEKKEEGEAAGCVGVQGEYTPVIFGLETTDFNHKTASIIQISAMPWVESECIDALTTFNVYTLPIHSLNPYAADINGFQLKGTSLLRYGASVEALSHREGLEGFLEYLRNLETPPERRKKLLVAHNASRFHSLILVRHIETYDLLVPFEEEVIGFSDTLSVIRELDPDRKISLKNYKRDCLALDNFEKFPEMHDCVENVKKIADLLNHYKASAEVVRKHSYNLGYSSQDLLQSQ